MRVARWIAAFLVAVIVPAGQCFSQTVPASNVVHILVQARTLAGDPIDGLTGRDFKVSQPDTPLQMRVLSAESPRSRSVSTSNEPVHVLLMISAYSDYSSEDAIVSLLTENLPEKFGNVRMAVCQRNGRITDYVGSRAELEQQIKSFRSHREYFDDALSELGRYPGQRSLIYFSEHGVNIPPPLRRKAEQVAALTYQVGGSRSQNYIVGNEAGASSTSPSMSMGDHFIYGTVEQGGVGILAPSVPTGPSAEKSVREVLVLKSLKAAYRSVANEGRGFYDLTLEVPQEVRSLDLKLDLNYDYQLTAQDYSPGERISPVIHLPTRQVSLRGSATLQPF